MASRSFTLFYSSLYWNINSFIYYQQISSQSFCWRYLLLLGWNDNCSFCFNWTFFKNFVAFSSSTGFLSN